ncbi:uncharacterized protein O3Q21_015508 [Podargus strigoides]
MAEGHPQHHRVTPEEVEAPQEHGSPAEPPEEPRRVDASWLPVYEEEQGAVDFILAFLSSPEKNEAQKLDFLKCISMMCKTARCRGLAQGLDIFCHRYKLAENVKAILEEVPGDQLNTAVYQCAIMATAELSLVEGTGRSLLEACVSCIFCLPREEEMWGMNIPFYNWNLQSLDFMLKMVVLNSPAPRVSEELQRIFEMLLNFTRSERAAVQERALGRIGALSYLLASNCSQESLPQSEGATCSPVSLRVIQVPILGQLLGRLILFGFSKNETGCTALDALHWLQEYIQQRQSRSVPKYKGRWLPWKRGTSSLRRAMAKHMVVTNYLTASERTDMVLEAIEALRDSSSSHQGVARILLDVVAEDPDFTLAHVPKIMSCIHQCLECISMKSAWQSVKSLLLLLTSQCPTTVFTAMLTLFPPGDRSAMTMWEVIFSMPQKVKEIFRVFSSKLQMHSTSPSAQAEVFLFLDVLIRLSGRAGPARNMQVLQTYSKEVLQGNNKEMRMKALLVFPHVMSHLGVMEASPIAVQLAKKLLPLFDEGPSLLRELSIRLFIDLLEAVVGRDKKRMKKVVRRALLPLFLHLSDQSDSVAQASGEALLAAAELLKWKPLTYLAQTEETWRTGECLLVQDRSRAGAFCLQSLPYLKDAQATLREAAVRFIGLAARDQSEEQLRGIIRALEPLKEDSDATVRVLAAQTISTLSSPRVQPSSGRSLRALFSWFR